ncbi:DNA-binding transcriptional regulator [Enterobacter asburiae]|uniref:DNA-binding transcriptional regulator n=1 Tax=Enterobacter asburiae TaxID=61645 RepID=A0A376FEX9_ENTAS|nr:DNA-binding transcriptional regulator [Enterobacter asburiae]
MLLEVQDVHEQLYAFNNTPIGTLRIGCSSTMAQNVLAAMTADMLKEYPGLTVNLVTGIPAPDLIADGLDVVIRVGALQDSSLFSRRLGSMPMVVCASKSYLAQYGVPEKPADLTNHSWLEYSVRPDNEFELIAPEGISTKLLPEGRFVTNDPMTISRWLVAGAGDRLRAVNVGDQRDQQRRAGDPLPALPVRSASGVRPVYRKRQTPAQGTGVY